MLLAKHRVRIALVALFVGTLTACSALGKTSFKNIPVKPAPAHEIDMVDNQGEEFRLSDQQGKVVLIYFGFTNCPDECPTTMAHIKQALTIDGVNADSVQVVMVSTDPLRDTPQALTNFLGSFNPSFLGITGSIEDLKQIWSDYDVQVLAGGMTHSSYTFVIDKKGDLRLNFDPEASPEDIAYDLKILLAEN